MNLSTAFHPQTDGQAAHSIKTLEYTLKAFLIYFIGNWDDHLPLIDFAYNTLIIRVSKCLHMKHFMGEDEYLLLGCLKLEKQG